MSSRGAFAHEFRAAFWPRFQSDQAFVCAYALRFSRLFHLKRVRILTTRTKHFSKHDAAIAASGRAVRVRNAQSNRAFNCSRAATMAATSSTCTTRVRLLSSQTANFNWPFRAVRRSFRRAHYIRHCAYCTAVAGVVRAVDRGSGIGAHGAHF